MTLSRGLWAKIPEAIPRNLNSIFKQFKGNTWLK
ncbi:hypothetical protein C4K00_2900 [Pseudomonas synxantha]|nr:hypothetical protein C4K00_2900 [Pseudomonas synxantha]